MNLWRTLAWKHFPSDRKMNDPRIERAIQARWFNLCRRLELFDPEKGVLSTWMNFELKGIEKTESQDNGAGVRSLNDFAPKDPVFVANSMAEGDPHQFHLWETLMAQLVDDKRAGPEERIFVTALLGWVDEAVGTLDSKQKLVLELRMNGSDTDEVGRVIGTSASYGSRIYHSALKGIREYLEYTIELDQGAIDEVKTRVFRE
ncbi:Uncharacterised protein [Candidatus Burarchaeum australiense]|nr:Uncharacterised protein [Candidatus Burarchaeum australiense]